jgi:putative hydrolase of the HAD superfamily
LDAVGTLIHPEPSAAAIYAAAAERFHSRLDLATIAVRFRAAFRRQEELDLGQRWCCNEDRELARWRAIVGEVLDDVRDPEACFLHLYAHFARPEAWRCEPGTGAVLQALRDSGYRLAIASNFDGRLHGVVAGLAELRVVEEVVVSSQVGWRKPAGGFFQALCRRLGLPPEQILLVGDDLVNDYEGARAAGSRAVLFDPLQRSGLPEGRRITHLNELLALKRSNSS